MSVQFGRWNFEGQPPAPDYIEKVSATLAPYGPDSNESYSKGGVRILYRAFHTTKESHRETQPHISPSGAVITWDGRLDNRAELISELRDSLTSQLHGRRHRRGGVRKVGDVMCFAKLIGDWALSIWNPKNRSLILGQRPHRHTSSLLFVRQQPGYVEHHPRSARPVCGQNLRPSAKSTSPAGSSYISGGASDALRRHRFRPTVFLRGSSTRKTCHQQVLGFQISTRASVTAPTPNTKSTSARSSRKAVQRRLRSDRPVLAELSGGMDSSSIVCMADTIIARGDAGTPRVDTISWYDESDEALNELPYVIKVEEERGRAGCHINTKFLTDVGPNRSLSSDFCDRFSATPVPRCCHSEFSQQYAAYMTAHGHRVTLSGIGGNEVTGGCVPTPKLEIQNLLVRARFVALFRQLKAWALKMRTPQLWLLWEATRGFLPFAIVGLPNDMRPAPWFCRGFVRRNHTALCGSPSRVKVFGPLPSLQDNLDSLDGLRRLLASVAPLPELLREIRYPYLDLNLLEFLYSIPREQIVRVGQRRSLMRRALFGIVPDKLLNRRQKASVPQPPTKGSYAEWSSLVAAGQDIVCSSIGIIDPNRLLESLQRSSSNDEVSTCILRRTVTFESWLRHVTSQVVLTNSVSTDKEGKRRSLHPFRSRVHRATTLNANLNKERR